MPRVGRITHCRKQAKVESDYATYGHRKEGRILRDRESVVAQTRLPSAVPAGGNQGTQDVLSSSNWCGREHYATRPHMLPTARVDANRFASLGPPNFLSTRTANTSPLQGSIWEDLLLTSHRTESFCSTRSEGYRCQD